MRLNILLRLSTNSDRNVAEKKHVPIYLRKNNSQLLCVALPFGFYFTSLRFYDLIRK